MDSDRSETVRMDAARGTVEARWDAPPEPTSTALLMVGGGDGGFDGPAEALYPTLACDAVERGWGALRVDFRIHRFPNDVEEGVHDVRAGLAWLRNQGIERVGLVGHSFGGAVVIEAGAGSRLVRAVVTLASQTGGVRSVSQLSPRPLLLIHGEDDIRLPPQSSELLFAYAREPKQLVVIPGARHSLRQARAQVRERILMWFERAFSEGS